MICKRGISVLEREAFLLLAALVRPLNITIGYTLPNRLTRRIGIESVRVYGVADNVALWSRRKGLDPRQSFTTSESAIYGGARCISGGIKLTF